MMVYGKCATDHIFIFQFYILLKRLYAKKIEFKYNTQLSFDFHKSRNCTVYVYQKQNAEKKDFIEEACCYKFSVIIFCLKMTFLIYGHQKEVHISHHPRGLTKQYEKSKRIGQ